jgi:hypothetical protein
VPQNKDLKRLVRARMAETSENYTQALTALLGETRLDPLPDGWFIAGTRPADYDAGLLPQESAYDGRRVLRLRFRATDPPGGFGTVMQSIDARRDPAWAGKLTEEDRRGLSPLFWSHVNPYGRFRLDMDSRLDLTAA